MGGADNRLIRPVFFPRVHSISEHVLCQFPVGKYGSLAFPPHFSGLGCASPDFEPSLGAREQLPGTLEVEIGKAGTTTIPSRKEENRMVRFEATVLPTRSLRGNAWQHKVAPKRPASHRAHGPWRLPDLVGTGGRCFDPRRVSESIEEITSMVGLGTQS